MNQTGQSQEASDSGETVPKSKRSRMSRKRLILFRCLVIAFPIILIILAETSLRIGGYGESYTIFKKAPDGSTNNLYYLNPDIDLAYCQENLRGPEPRPFQIPRGSNELRVLVVGASSVQGYPYPSELSFPRQLECVLSSQFPDKEVTVLNAGIVGLSTLPLCDVVQQCSSVEPSLVVFYGGHNEFYGVGGVNTNAKLSSNQLFLSRFRLMQLLSRKHSEQGQQQANDQPLISKLPRNFAIPPGSQLVEDAELYYKFNVQSMANYCDQRKIPLLLVSPVCNLRGQSPLPLPDQKKRLSQIFAEVGQPLESENATQYLSLLQSALDTHPDDAALHYRLGQCFELLEKFGEARQHFSLARDFDPCRYRASSSFGPILEEIAAASQAGTTHLDAQQVFFDESQYCVPGDDLFLEHVHFNLAGHWLLAKTIARETVEKLQLGTWDEQRIPTLPQRDDWLGLIPEDELSGNYLAFYLSQNKPFEDALDAAEHLMLLKNKIDLQRSQIGEKIQFFDALPNQVKVDDLIDGLGRLRLDRNEIEEAEMFFRKSIKRRPWMPNGYLFTAICRYQSGDLSNARKLLIDSQEAVLPPTPRVLNDQRRLQNLVWQITPDEF